MKLISSYFYIIKYTTIEKSAVVWEYFFAISYKNDFFSVDLKAFIFVNKC